MYLEIVHVIHPNGLKLRAKICGRLARRASLDLPLALLTCRSGFAIAFVDFVVQQGIGLHKYKWPRHSTGHIPKMVLLVVVVSMYVVVMMWY